MVERIIRGGSRSARRICEDDGDFVKGRRAPACDRSRGRSDGRRGAPELFWRAYGLRVALPAPGASGNEANELLIDFDSADPPAAAAAAAVAVNAVAVVVAGQLLRTILRIIKVVSIIIRQADEEVRGLQAK